MVAIDAEVRVDLLNLSAECNRIGPGQVGEFTIDRLDECLQKRRLGLSIATWPDASDCRHKHMARLPVGDFVVLPGNGPDSESGDRGKVLFERKRVDHVDQGSNVMEIAEVL